ncbi:glycosyltransferase family 4 protein [Afifella aestuarii]|uniref:glycosyltransferase family 4 protein n=1 Tax=Afifella aestuarii TaxID=1909496 RepID=UPI0013E33DA3|nr:glycosyltransferase family 4 protein [Afifella aestuarii]
MQNAGDPLRILHVLRAPVGGVFRHVCDLVQMQAARGHQVGIICDSTTGGAFEADRLTELADYLPLGLVRTPMSRPIRPQDLGALLRVRAHAATLAPDIIHGHGAKGGIFSRLAAVSERRKRRAVANFYTLHGGSLHFDKQAVTGRLYFRVERSLERVTDALVHVSAFEAETYREKVGEPRCPARVIYNGLRPDEFWPVEKVGAPTDFLLLGELRPLKGVDVLLGALARMAEKGHRPSLCVVGSGVREQVETYRAFAAEKDLDVRFHAPMPARQALAQAHMIVVPSLAESLPYVVLEAAAAGTPMIATRVGGIPEIFSGEEDRLIEPGNVRALASALTAALENPQRLVEEAAARRAFVHERFSLSGMAEENEALYHEALSRRRGGPSMDATLNAA